MHSASGVTEPRRASRFVNLTPKLLPFRRWPYGMAFGAVLQPTFCLTHVYCRCTFTNDLKMREIAR